MFANKVKKVAAIHDLSGMGRVSLTVVIPILSSMGFQVCPLPTAILSNHTQYPDFTFLDLTDEMPRIIAEWKRLEVEFDAIIPVIWDRPDRFRLYLILFVIFAEKIV
jgi:pyridoxine kinase